MKKPKKIRKYTTSGLIFDTFQKTKEVYIFSYIFKPNKNRLRTGRRCYYKKIYLYKTGKEVNM